jgi:hypothetical protein
MPGAKRWQLTTPFISYSHGKDKPIAAALQAVVQKLGKPWYLRRAVRVDPASVAVHRAGPRAIALLHPARFA